jgi:hypothetical protein
MCIQFCFSFTTLLLVHRDAVAAIKPRMCYRSAKCCMSRVFHTQTVYCHCPVWRGKVERLQQHAVGIVSLAEPQSALRCFNVPRNIRFIVILFTEMFSFGSQTCVKRTDALFIARQRYAGEIVTSVRIVTAAFNVLTCHHKLDCTGSDLANE